MGSFGEEMMNLVSKTRSFCIKYDEFCWSFCIKYDEFCWSFCIKYDEFCWSCFIKYDEFCRTWAKKVGHIGMSVGRDDIRY